MSERVDLPDNNERNIWVRGLYMLLMVLICHLAGTVLFVLSLIQFVMTLLTDTPNSRLVSFGRSLALYIQQAANFLVCATEELPFPFKDWPPGD